MDRTKHTVPWYSNTTIFSHRILPILYLLGALLFCVMCDMLAWEMVKISEIIAEFRYSTGPLLGDTIWLFARPWVHCGLWFGFGFAIMKLQLSWIRSNEGILLRAYTGSGSVKLSLTERARLTIIFGIPYLIFAGVFLVDIWHFSVAAIIVPQFFAYKDLSRIYQTAKDTIAKV